MIEASRRLQDQSYNIIGVYLSLRHVPLLRSTGQEYERLFCELLSDEIGRKLAELPVSDLGFGRASDVASLQSRLRELVERTNKRIVILFDDVAHIGREASLEEFFGIFRTISSNSVSCKASIYPGVTRFGIRFDVYNDATVFDLARDERSSGYSEFFAAVLRSRFPDLESRIDLWKSVSTNKVASFLGRSVVGNMRGFVFACTRLQGQSQQGFPALDSVLKGLAAEYYWPLLEELEPKLGIYRPLVETSRELADIIFKHVASQESGTTVIIHRDIVQRLAKTFEILEYAGFIAKREASRALRSGGRGPRFALNLANLLEVTPKARLTKSLFEAWQSSEPDQFTEIHNSGNIISIAQPLPAEDSDLQILALSIEKLIQGRTYPYGLTEAKIAQLQMAGFNTIGDLAEARLLLERGSDHWRPMGSKDSKCCWTSCLDVNGLRGARVGGQQGARGAEGQGAPRVIGRRGSGLPSHHFVTSAVRIRVVVVWLRGQRLHKPLRCGEPSPLLGPHHQGPHGAAGGPG